jgi:hypothetical protein
MELVDTKVTDSGIAGMFELERLASVTGGDQDAVSCSGCHGCA